MASLDEIFGVQQQATRTPPQGAPQGATPKTSLDDIFKGTGPAKPVDEIDTKTGAPVAVRTELQRASNPEEAKLVLEKRYGKGNYGQDESGNWWVNQDGKKTSVLPGGFKGGLENVATGMLASGFPMMGAVAGGVLGEAAFPAGGGIPGAMMGAAAGKGLEDVIKWAEGKFAQKPAEVVSGMSTEGAWAGAAQGAGPLAKQALGGIRAGLQSFTGTTPATRTMAQDISAGGGVPPVGSYAPGATALEYKRQLRNMLAGNPAEAKNIAFLTQRMNQIFTLEGISEPERQAMIDEVYNTSSRASTRSAGQAIVEKAGQIHSGFINDFEKASAEANKYVTDVDKTLRQIAQPAASTAQDVSDAIVTGRRQFSRQMSDVYKSIDRMTGDQPVVKTDMIKAAADELIQIMPPEAVPPLLKRWAAADAPTAITFEQAHALRSTLREMAEITDVSPMGQKLGNVRKVAASVDRAINNVSDTVGQQAATALKTADKQYSEGIAKFNNTQINKMVRDLRSGIVPEPGTTARLIMNPDNINLARTVFKMLPETVQNNVVKADLGNIIQQSSRLTKDGTQLLDGKSLLQVLNERGKLMEATYPKGAVAPLRQYAEELAAYDGQIDLKGIKTPTALTALLKQGADAMKAADEFVKMNPLGAFVHGSPVQVDRALARLTQAGSEKVTEEAASTLGIDSPEWRQVRKYAMQRVFSQAMVEKPTLAKTVSGGQIDAALNKFTKRQQELLFPGGLADDMRLVAQEAKFLFPEHAKDLGTSLAAASIKSGLWLNPVAVSKYVFKNISGYIADHPRLLKYLAGEIRQDPVHARSVMSVMGQWMLNRAVRGGPGHGSPQQDTGLGASMASRSPSDDFKMPSGKGDKEARGPTPYGGVME